MEKLLVGLGNPGKQYQQTRHNIGQRALQEASFCQGLHWKEKFKGHFASEAKNHFLVPLIYMNLSGESVAPAANFFKIDIANILIVYDEIDLPFGTLVFKQGGGLAGHNGLKSVAQHLGGQDFARLRMGVGRPDHGSVSDYVLGQFDKQEKELLPEFLQQASSAMKLYIEKGFQKAASMYSQTSVVPHGT